MQTLARIKAALLCAALLLTLIAPQAWAGKPLKVYILAGQSNMEGHARTTTFDYIGEDPKTAPLLKLMRGADGNPAVANNVYVSNYTGFFDNNGVTTGKLTAGFGARRNPTELGDKIGPEFTFGLTMAKHYDGPILLIKTVWGGKSLHTDFRPPSAGPYKLNAWQLENYPKQEGHGIPKDFEQWKIDKKKATGHYYRLMAEHVKKVLADPGKVVPGYDKDAGYEVAGFVWFQGWNDMVDSQTYPERHKPGGYDVYSKLMATFIKDVRREFDAPEMPFVIGVMGVGGPIQPDAKNKSQQHFRDAMAAPAKAMKNVVAVPTAPYWSQELAAIDASRGKVRQMSHLLRSKNKNHANADGSMDAAAQKAYVEKYKAELISPEDEALWNRGASNAGYHYLGCGKTMAQIGEAFAKALIQ